jgi:hypothetical protein
MPFPIPSFGHQPTSRCRTAGSISLMPKMGYHFNMSRPGTPLTPTEWDNARNTPGPGSYGDPGGMSSNSMLPSGGEFCNQELPSAITLHVASKLFVPGPGKYEDVIFPMDGGVKFSTAYVPSQIDKLIKVAKRAPSSADYRPEDCKIVYPRPDRNVCPFTRSLRPSFVDETIRSKSYVPGPSSYQQSSSKGWSKDRTMRKKYARGGNNVGPSRRSTVSSYLDDIHYIWSTMEMASEKDGVQEEMKNKEIKVKKHSNDRHNDRPMTSPQKFQLEQKTLWKKKRKIYPGTMKTRKNALRGNNRPNTTSNKRSSQIRSTASYGGVRSNSNKIMNAVTNRSRAELSRKLTSPLWKYEIPKKLLALNQRPKSKSKQKSYRRHNSDATLNDLFTPTSDRPFLTLKETMELAQRNLRALDASINSKRRREVLGIL